LNGPLNRAKQIQRKFVRPEQIVFRVIFVIVRCGGGLLGGRGGRGLVLVESGQWRNKPAPKVPMIAAVICSSIFS